MYLCLYIKKSQEYWKYNLADGFRIHNSEEMIIPREIYKNVQ